MMQSFQARGISATRNDTALIAALLRDWQHKGSARGFCAVTSAKEAYASCTTAEKGSFALSTHELATAREHVDSAWTATAACISLCLGCANCNFISVSSRWNDCSWFARCDLDRLLEARLELSRDLGAQNVEAGLVGERVVLPEGVDVELHVPRRSRAAAHQAFIGILTHTGCSSLPFGGG